MMRVFFLLLLGAVFGISRDARAADCMAECFYRGAESRKARLLCEVACERRDPKNVAYCPEYTPCILSCEIQFPEELVNDLATKNEKVKCMGTCMTKYFKIGCEEPPPDQPGGGGGNGSSSSVSNGQGDSAVTPKAGMVSALRAVPQNQIGEVRSSTSDSAEGGASAAEAIVIKPIPRNTGKHTIPTPAAPKTFAGPQQAASAPLMGSSAAPVTDLMESVLAEEAEPTLFLRVSRKYRETERFFNSGAGKPE